MYAFVAELAYRTIFPVGTVGAVIDREEVKDHFSSIGIKNDIRNEEVGMDLLKKVMWQKREI